MFEQCGLQFNLQFTRKHFFLQGDYLLCSSDVTIHKLTVGPLPTAAKIMDVASQCVPIAAYRNLTCITQPVAINVLESGVTGDTWESWLKNSFNAPRDATRYPISSVALPVRLDRQRIMIAR